VGMLLLGTDEGFVLLCNDYRRTTRVVLISQRLDIDLDSPLCSV
jgi:hypothetical protein